VKRALAAAAAGALLALPAAAHQTSLSYSSWTLDAGGARVSVRVSELDLSRLGLAFQSTGAADDPVAAYLTAHLRLDSDAGACAPERAPALRDAPEGWVVYAWRARCPGGPPRQVSSALFLDVAPSHLHFARLTDAAGASRERVLSEAEPTWALPADPGASGAAAATGGTPLSGYVVLGIEHILAGWDHLAFVLALLLLAGTLREVAALVTSFTVAHSVTLALATLGVLRPEAHAVEALIGFSIALVAAENAWILAGRDRWLPWLAAGFVLLLAALPGGAVPRLALLGLSLFTLCHFGLLRRSPRPARLRAAVAFAFGLVHGFGFAGVLAELELPTARLATALFGFNLGVELGQLGVVAVVWPLFRVLERRAGAGPARRLTEAASAGICGLGIYWFVVRSLG
jgi:hypothetical protein